MRKIILTLNVKSGFETDFFKMCATLKDTLIHLNNFHYNMTAKGGEISWESNGLHILAEISYGIGKKYSDIMSVKNVLSYNIEE